MRTIETRPKHYAELVRRYTNYRPERQKLIDELAIYRTDFLLMFFLQKELRASYIVNSIIGSIQADLGATEGTFFDVERVKAKYSID